MGKIAVYKALTIAGSDSGGGAGIQADIKTFTVQGVYGTSVLTAVTAQNTLGVQAVELLSPALVSAQITSVLDDIGADAVKTGMLGSAAIIEIVAEMLQRYGVQQLIVDPVMVSTSGTRLLAEKAVDVLRLLLFPLALVVTPNLPEASVLLGQPIQDERDMETAVHTIHAMGPRYVLLKGGHLAGDPVDLLFDGKTIHRLHTQRIMTPHTHGTGCTYSAAITALLARGLAVEQAVFQAKQYLTNCIRDATPIGTGRSPVAHFPFEKKDASHRYCE